MDDETPPNRAAFFDSWRTAGRACAAINSIKRSKRRSTRCADISWASSVQQRGAIDDAPIGAHRGLQACIQGIADQRVADRDFLHIGDSLQKHRQIVLIEIVS